MGGRPTESGPTPPNMIKNQWSFLPPVVIDTAPIGRLLHLRLLFLSYVFVFELLHLLLLKQRRSSGLACTHFPIGFWIVPLLCPLATALEGARGGGGLEARSEMCSIFCCARPLYNTQCGKQYFCLSSNPNFLASKIVRFHEDLISLHSNWLIQ